MSTKRIKFIIEIKILKNLSKIVSLNFLNIYWIKKRIQINYKKGRLYHIIEEYNYISLMLIENIVSKDIL